jgi:hypothetical protein
MLAGFFNAIWGWGRLSIEGLVERPIHQTGQRS